MSRIKELQKQVHKVLEKLENGDKRAKAVAHLHGVALAAAVLAKKRGQDPELATMAGLLHDLYAYKSGSYDDHAHLGAEYARKLLGKLALTTEAEMDVVCAAIWHHDGKAEVDGPMDEILKDADVLHHSLSDPTKAVKPHEQERYARLCAELGLGE